MSDDTTTTILAAIADEPKTVTEIVEETGLGETTVRKAVKDLEDAGRLEEAGKNGRAATYRAVGNEPEKETEEPAPQPSTESLQELLPGGKSPAKKKEAREKGPDKREVAASRDRMLLETIKASGDGLTRVQLAEKADVKESLVYMSLWRLHKAGDVEKVPTGTRTPVWKAASA